MRLFTEHQALTEVFDSIKDIFLSFFNDSV